MFKISLCTWVDPSIFKMLYPGSLSEQHIEVEIKQRQNLSN